LRYRFSCSLSGLAERGRSGQVRHGLALPQLVDVMNTFMGIHEVNSIMNVNPTNCGLSGARQRR
jgi:hypothetical protein